MLLGTALASTLLVGSVFAPSPAGAQTVIETQSKTAGASRHKTNSGKRTTTIETIILNAEPLLDNSYAASNSLDRDQSIDLTQTNALESDIVIINSGFIDPLIGIDSQIENVVGSFSNNAAISNAYGATASVDVVQGLKLTQANTIANEISKNNSGNIVADVFGIIAEINNLPIGSLANDVAASNANGAATAITLRDVTQSADFIQTNTIGSDITIVNSGDLDADIGIIALINAEIVGSLANNAAISNANGSATAFDLLGLTQTIDLVQGNAIGSSIEIHNHGAMAGVDTGLIAEINHRTIGSLANNAVGIGPGLSNANGTVEAIGLANLDQVINLQQSNEISGDLSLYNYGSIDTDCCGVDAQIHTDAIGSLANNATVSNANGAADGVTLAQITQSSNLDQANTIDNAIGVYNHGEIGSGVGINASIDSQSVDDLYNDVTAINANGEVGLVDAEAVVQSFDLGQQNIVESQIVIANYSGVEAGSVGIHAVIATSDIDEMQNVIDADNVNGNAALVTVGSLDQSANFTQYNTVFSQIVVDDAGTTDAETGILAEISSRSLNLGNEAAIENINETTTLIDDDDLDQSAHIVQNNAVTNDISIKTSAA